MRDHVQDFLARYEEGRPAPGPERAEWDKSKVQNFLLWMEGAIRQSNVWKGCTEEEMEHSAEGIEVTGALVKTEL